MEAPGTTTVRIGAWRVDPASGTMSRNGETAQLDSRALRLLLLLVERAGSVVTTEELLERGWPGVVVSPDSVYQAIASLRRLLGDDSKQPAYIATVPRIGYRLVAPVAPGREWRRWLVGGTVAATLCLILVLAALFHADAQSQKSIAVLPFRDLTTDMNEEPFADGMTEELIDRLSKLPGLRVPGPRSSFYFRGKRLPVADIANMLGVAYLLDGSVRKSGGRLRVSARLIRAQSGYVIWSAAYDRPVGDILRIQDDIAGKVTNALQASIR
jgi:transcriptional activator of cad operon